LLLSERDVGWYGAAYKPVTVMLAVPITYFVGYFSVLSRAHAEDKEEFTRIVHRSLRLTCLLAIPVGIGVSLLAAPLVLLLFGIEYAPAVPVLQMLAWSAVLVVLRGNYRHALHAAGKQDADLRFSYVATGMNIVLNCLWIPQYGMIGAAWATVISEVAWLLLSWFGYRRHVSHMAILPFLWRPLLAGALLASGLHWLPIEIWFLRAFVATVIYFAALWALADPELRNWLRMLRGN
jgi:O-antigen/teichoic acid export membrane protein